MTIRLCTREELPLVLAMSDAFVAEGCCNGMVPDTLSELEKYEIYIALDGETPVGYAYGQAETAQRTRGQTQKDERYFEVEQIYVCPQYRAAGCGRALFETLENHARALGCQSMQLAAVSKDYKRLLHFYVDLLGMEFWNAFLTKRL